MEVSVYLVSRRHYHTNHDSSLAKVGWRKGGKKTLCPSWWDFPF